MGLMDYLTNSRPEPQEFVVEAQDLTEDPQAVASNFVELLPSQEIQYIGKPRASSLYDACIRKHVLGTKHKVKKTAYVGVRDRLVFGIGNAMHHWLQNSPDMFGDRRRGFWRCRACGKTTKFGPPPAGPCKCGASVKSFIYHEFGLNLKNPPITGHPDMFLEKHNGPVRIAEFKTIEGEAFNRLTYPLIPHVWQITVYMWGCSLSNKIPEIDTKYGYVFYFTKKQTSNTFPVKAFPVTIERHVAVEIQEKLKLYSDGISGAPVPIHYECESSKFQHSRAKYCPVLEYCRDAQR